MSESTRNSASAPEDRQSAAAALGREISTLCSYVYAAEARLIALIGRFDSEDCHEALGFPSTAHWLNYQCGVGMNAAREKIRVARALPDLPRIRESFENGVLSYSKVRALTRIAVPANELQLLEFARQGTAHHVERLVSKVRRAQRQEAETKAELVYASRSLSWFHDEDGALVVKARLPADQGALLLKALEHAVEAARTERADDVTAVTSDGPATHATRRADALTRIAETYLSHPDNEGSTADRYQVIVHVAAETPGDDVTAVTSYLEDGPQVTAETSRRIACDCSLLPVRENVFGEPLDIGRKTRSIPPAIRRALTLRDGGCRFPGCTHTRVADGHHIVHWADGGETSLDNLVLLCRYHHRQVHEGGFVCRRTDTGAILFEDCRHHRLHDAAPLPGIGMNIDTWLDKQFFESGIDETTCRARFDAGAADVDWHMAVAGIVAAGDQDAGSAPHGAVR